jgi:hypothetical protein
LISGLSTIPALSLPHQAITHDNVNNVMYDDESNWLKRNDHYQMQQIGGRMRVVAMPHSQEMQTLSTIISDIAQGNDIVLAHITISTTK